MPEKPGYGAKKSFGIQNTSLFEMNNQGLFFKKIRNCCSEINRAGWQLALHDVGGGGGGRGVQSARGLFL